MASASVKNAPAAGRFSVPGLDGIRGLAVLVIFIFHAEILPHIPGELATTVFFFLSGFLITTLFVREHRKTGDINLGAFYCRRALRILPPLYLVLALSFIASRLGHVGEPLTGWKTMGNFFQYTNYAIAMTGDTAGFLPGMILLWSLAVDEHYYLVCAPLFRAVFKRFQVRYIVAAILLLCVAALMWRIFLVHEDGSSLFRVSMASDTRVDSILWGALLALWRNPALEPSRASFLARPAFVVLGCIGLLIPMLSGSAEFKNTFGYTLEGLSLIPLFAVAILNGGKGWLRFLNWPWLLWTSRISYPLYLVSWFSISACAQFVPGPRLFRVTVAFVAAISLASAIHLWLERPLMALRKRKPKAREAPTQETLEMIPLAS